MSYYRRHTITVSGCDDSTEVTMSLTDTEASTIRKIAELITAASTYGCEPRMSITEQTGDTEQ